MNSLKTLLSLIFVATFYANNATAMFDRPAGTDPLVNFDEAMLEAKERLRESGFTSPTDKEALVVVETRDFTDALEIIFNLRESEEAESEQNKISKQKIKEPKTPDPNETLELLMALGIEDPTEAELDLYFILDDKNEAIEEIFAGREVSRQQARQIKPTLAPIKQDHPLILFAQKEAVKNFFDATMTGSYRNKIFITSIANELTLCDQMLGRLGPGLSNFKMLTSLTLMNDSLTSLADEVGELVNLVSLNVNGNYLTTLPDLSALQKLETLLVESNQLLHVHSGVFALIRLSMLDLSRNNLPEISSGIGNLTNLEYLKLSNNELTSIPDEIYGLALLNHLDLSKNRIASVNEKIGDLFNLTALKLDHNKIAKMPNALEELPFIKHLSLLKNKFTNLPDISNFEWLVFLSVDYKAAKNSFAELDSLKRIRFVDLGKFKLSEYRGDDPAVYNFRDLIKANQQLQAQIENAEAHELNKAEPRAPTPSGRHYFVYDGTRLIECHSNSILLLTHW